MKTITAKELNKKLGAFVKVRQGEVKNEMTIYFENGKICQSYDTIVAARCGGVTYLYPCHDYSKTTNKHVIRFCGMSLPERRKALESGEAIYVER